MNKARYAAAVIAAVGVSITGGGAAAAIWQYRHEPVPRSARAPAHATVAASAPVLPQASSAPYPHAAIHHPGAFHFLGTLEPNTPTTYLPVTRFSGVAGRRPNITVYYSPWGTSFRARFVTAAAQAGAAVLVHMEPWHASMTAIADGRWDTYLHRFAAQVRHYGGPVILSFAPEADGSWYPWGWHQAEPAEYRAAWRHVVTLFRQSGASNVTWLWDISGGRPRAGRVRYFWPGPQYVDWIGIDGYYVTPADTFKSVIGDTISAVRRFTKKPILLSEVGIGPLAGQVKKIPNLFAGIRRNRLLGLIYFDVAQHDGLYHQDWRLDDNPAAVAAFRAGVRSLGAPGSSQGPGSSRGAGEAAPTPSALR
jgi:mannan endo-1,4-beta-mannosidase